MRRALFSVLAASAACFAVPALPASQAAQPSPEPLRYVAMGDSYSAASGVQPPDPSASPFCLRSLLNYPHLLAAATGAQLTDVTCGGADTGDYFEAQHEGTPPQLEALGADTDLVTMTIGGNDQSVFISSIVKCGAAGVSTAGRGSPCKDEYGRSFARTIRRKTYPALLRALNAVRAKAPEAEVAIIGYPWILPARVGCFDKMPVARGDVPYLHHVQWVLNDAVRRAASATGTTYVNVGRASKGHDACQDLGERWVEPVLQGTNPVVVHPNAFGEERMAARVMRVLGLR